MSENYSGERITVLRSESGMRSKYSSKVQVLKFKLFEF